MVAFVGIWAILVGIVCLNGFAAGVVGVLHAWQSRKTRNGKVLTAVVLTGMLPTLTLIPAMLPQVAIGTEAPIAMVVGAAMVFVVGVVVSLPGAIIVARKFDQGGNEFRAFE